MEDAEANVAVLYGMAGVDVVEVSGVVDMLEGARPLTTRAKVSLNRRELPSAQFMSLNSRSQ